MFSWKILKNRVCLALLLGAVSLSAAADPVLSTSATPVPAVKGHSVDLDVRIADISDLYAYQFSFNFNPAVLQVSGVSEGAFLGAGGSTFFDGGTIDNTLGSISFSFNTLIGAGPGVSGSGSLAHISFNVIEHGSSSFSFSDVLFLDSGLHDLPLQVVTTPLLAVPEPATYLMFGAGLAGLMLLRRRQRN